MLRQDLDIAIIGAGPVGGTLALALAARGRRVLLVDRADLPPMEDPAFDGRGYAIAAGCQALFATAGIWDALPFAPCPILDIDVTDGRVGRRPSALKLHFDHKAVGDAFGWIIEARSIRVAINKRLHEAGNVTLRAPATARVVRDGQGADVHVGDEIFRVKLVVAAEGRKSPLRQQAGIRVTKLPYNQSAVIFALAHEKPHNGVALEHFLPGGPFAVLPMTGTTDHPNLSAVVFTERDALAQRLYVMEDAAFMREIAARLGTRLGAFTQIGRRWMHRLEAMYAHRYYAERLVLVGDSAHGVHPIAGQGLNLGLQDVAALVDCLEGAADPGAQPVLARYQATRRPVNMAMLLGMDALDRLFSTNFAPLRLARDLGLAAVNRMPGLKRRFMLTAMGR
ncbi:UbiH/UbiF/VisC/COQ6 family ubiquinone biosynthesis hydroxylase [Acidocella sp.]|uniref:UbiH/UbiF/VisC/COQ6 family ubiquinone biosynthesis hydroxylase n=1 Tax=Acidocella sp. TaxID=50710 RepID=UPI002628ECB7|nr:UbiH/UbiF/VisC/COQ6 family ubiquinone biosynthesis hydroxylase [Acidocella sp.]